MTTHAITYDSELDCLLADYPPDVSDPIWALFARVIADLHATQAENARLQKRHEEREKRLAKVEEALESKGQRIREQDESLANAWSTIGSQSRRIERLKYKLLHERDARHMEEEISSAERARRLTVLREGSAN